MLNSGDCEQIDRSAEWTATAAHSATGRRSLQETCRTGMIVKLKLNNLFEIHLYPGYKRPLIKKYFLLLRSFSPSGNFFRRNAPQLTFCPSLTHSSVTQAC